jgi:tetratricopeptide (TPR) repeat protein
MLKKVRLFRYWLPLIVCAAFLSAVVAQEDSLEEFKYKEDYDRVQSIVKTPDVVKRAERMVTFYGERRDMRAELRDYADSMFARDMETLLKQGNFVAMKSLCDRALKARPKFGEAYLFYGVALKRDNKIDEALKAFARGYVIDNPLKAKAKQQLDVTYRSTGGSLSGEDKLIKDAMKELDIKALKK